jgi:hypothetical protein
VKRLTRFLFLLSAVAGNIAALASSEIDSDPNDSDPNDSKLTLTQII